MKRVFPIASVVILLCATGTLAVVVAPAFSATAPEPALYIEHIGLNVDNVVETVDWFTKNLGMKIARKTGDPSNAHFITDAAGRSMLEIYSNTSAPMPDYAKMDPLTLHIAFAVNDVASTRDRLIKAGATPQGDISTTPLGDTLAMLRTPQGIPIQLAKRKHSMLEPLVRNPFTR